MSNDAEVSMYNYRKFIGDDDFAAFRSALHGGDQALDGTVIVASTGESRKLSSFWRGRDLIIEFGSLT
ncbi:hypothetical protein BH23CHL5_BH23CHL5_25770 [soil metagenome]